MRRLALVILAAIGLAGAAQADPLPPLAGTLRAPALWQAYKAAFLSEGGRIVDNANGNVSHSEGQGYGLLLAVAADDHAAFDAIWGWTRAQLMLRDDGLAAWKWDPAATPHVGDRNNATDGDLLIAWALGEAGARWSDQAYAAASLELARSIVKQATAVSPFGLVLKPGVSGFDAKAREDGPLVNLSYWVFPALARLDALHPDPVWQKLTRSGLDLISAARIGPAGLAPDWLSLAGDDPRPAEGFAPTFGYDAIRIPLYVAWAGVGRKSTLTSFAALWQDGAAAPSRIDVTSGKPVEAMADSGYRAIAALLRCARGGDRLPAELQASTVDRYYPTTLRMLVLIAARQRFPQCL
jgi:endo-1,4-beta-D-glucanase Y